MKSKLSYKSKRNIIITVIIIALLAIIATAAYFFAKGNRDTTATFTENNLQVGESTQGEQEGLQTEEGQNNNENPVEKEEQEENEPNDVTEENEQENNEEETSESTTNQGGATSNSGVGTTETTTGDVPNEEYVTKRVEEQEVLVSENYAVAWAPLTIRATTTTADLSIIRPIILQSKTANKTAVVANDVITYTINVENAGTGNGVAKVKDVMPMTSELVEFIEGSIKINGTDTIKVGDKNITANDEEIAKLTAEDLSNGIDVNVPKATVEDTEVINGLVTISFEVRVKDNVEGTITNQAEVNDGKTNEVKIPILTYNKEVNRELLTIDEDGKIIDGNELEYTITITNTQEVSGYVTIQDSIPEGTEFVKESINIANTETIKVEEKEIEVSREELAKLTDENLENGIEVEILAEESVTLKFKVTVTDTSKTIENIGYVNNEPTNEVKTKIEAHIVFIEHGGTDVEDMHSYAGETIEDTTMPETTRPGYDFTGWYTEETEGTIVPELPGVYPPGTTYYHAQWTPRNDTKYVVKYYYQQDDGTYPTETDKISELRDGVTDTNVTVEDTDKQPETVEGKTYVFAEGHELNKLDGKVDAVDMLVLKVYFKLQFTVKYNPGTQGTFTEITKNNLDYNTNTPAYDGPKDGSGKPTGKSGYRFVGWNPSVESKVTENKTYTAQWEGLQVTKTRTSIVDVDKVTGLNFVDQVGDVIKYNITIQNIGDVSATAIILKDDHNVTVTSVIVNETTVLNTRKKVTTGNDLLAGLDTTIKPNETIVVAVEQEITPNDLSSSKVKNTATATLNDKEYKDEEETEVKERYSYTIKYLYNGVENTAEKISGTALLGTPLTLFKPFEKTYNGQKYQYIKYEGIGGTTSTQITTGENIIKIYYGKPELSITKTTKQSTINAGDNITYTIKVENTGHIGTTIEVTDDLVDTTFVSSSPDPASNSNNKLKWNVTLGAKASKTITLTVKSNYNTIDKTISNTAKISGTNKTYTATTKVNGITASFNEFKVGQTTEKLNIIFILDNSSSMNYAAADYKYKEEDTVPVAPTDEKKTRLYAAKNAITKFINTYKNSDISVITFNEKSSSTYTNMKTLVKSSDIYTRKGKKYAKYNGTEYEVKEEDILATNGKKYDAIHVPIPYGAICRGTSQANNTTSQENLIGIVSKISISSQQNKFDTFINPAFELASTYLSDKKKNIIVVVADGEFDDDDYTKQRDDLVNSKAWDKDEDEIYCIGLGAIGQAQYNTGKLKRLSTAPNDGKYYTSTSMYDLLDDFDIIYEEATGKSGEEHSNNGVIKLPMATKNILAPSLDSPIIVTYMDGTTKKTLFSCDDESELDDYGLEISGKYITWDVKTFATKQGINVPSVVHIQYYIPLE